MVVGKNDHHVQLACLAIKSEQIKSDQTEQSKSNKSRANKGSGAKVCVQAYILVSLNRKYLTSPIVAEKSVVSLASCLHFGHFALFSVIVAENNCNSLATLHFSHIYSKHSPSQSAHSPNQRRKIWHFFVKVSRKSWRYFMHAPQLAKYARPAAQKGCASYA